MTNAQLKAFHAVARFGSFTAAAARLSLSQPAVSDHIRNLEEAYGTQLFTRNPKGAVLTTTGKKLFAIVERLFETENEAAALLSQAKNLKQGELTIGADAAVHILPHIRKFNEKFPLVSIRLLSGNSADLIARLTDFTLDFAVAAARPLDPGIASLRMRQDNMIAIVKKTGPLASRKSIKLAELAQHTMVLREQGSATKTIVQKCFEQAGLRIGRVIEVEGREATQEAVAHGLGIAIISEGELTPDNRLLSLKLSDCHEKMEEWLLWLKSRTNLRLIEAFLATLKNI